MYQTKKGFTITELMLSMAIVSLLIVAIATTTIQMSKIMTKGKTMKELNVASRSINKDFTEKFNSIQSVWGWDGTSSASTPGGNSNYISNDRGGAFCTGEFSYLWNTANALRAGDGPIQYAGSKDNSIRLVRVRDVSKNYCSNPSSWENVPRDANVVTEIINAGEVDLMIYNISFRALSDAVSGQSLINIQYVLGTRSQDATQLISQQCQPQSDRADYCAINKFDLTVRTIGRK